MGRVLIVGTGLIGASVGLALRRAGCGAEIFGFDASGLELETALAAGAIDGVCRGREEAVQCAAEADFVVLAVPVLAILDWMEMLAPVCGGGTLVTDVGSTKQVIAERGVKLFGGEGRAGFLPGHPMAGKERGGAGMAEAGLFDGAMWLFTPGDGESSAGEAAWRGWVGKFGCRTMDLAARRHDVLCAWVSHLPQMVATAMAAMFEEEFGDAEEIAAIGGRALREMTRLGASPYSMWRDVAMTNTDAVAATLFAFEQRLAHVRENLRTAELREEFRLANSFRARRPG